jgi:hypothetical protein
MNIKKFLMNKIVLVFCFITTIYVSTIESAYDIYLKNITYIPIFYKLKLVDIPEETFILAAHKEVYLGKNEDIQGISIAMTASKSSGFYSLRDTLRYLNQTAKFNTNNTAIILIEDFLNEKWKVSPDWISQ